MVKCHLLIALFCVICFALHSPLSAQASQNIQVTSEISLYNTYADQPLSGSVTVTHPTNVPIDLNSFSMEGKPLQVEFVKKVPIPPLEIDFFHFELPAKSKGLYVLPSISVKVGGQVFQSVPASYEVYGRAPPNAPRAPQGGAQQPSVPGSIVLKSSVNGANPLYPGQQATLAYKFYYRGDIALTKEELPLLNPDGFKRIGDKQVKNYQEGDYNVQEIGQTIQAVKPGTFSFPASYIEGYTYTTDYLNRKSYIEPKLHSETAPLTIKVADFPTSGKPASFNGAVGEFTFSTRLLTPATVAVEDKMRLAIDIFSREAELNTVPIPDISPLKNYFRLSDLPPIGTVQGNTKEFVVEMYPLSTAITEIPSLAFSDFNPLSGQYDTLESNAIPIKVVPREKQIGRAHV
jgi:hypothetical protein